MYDTQPNANSSMIDVQDDGKEDNKNGGGRTALDCSPTNALQHPDDMSKKMLEELKDLEDGDESRRMLKNELETRAMTKQPDTDVRTGSASLASRE